MRKAGHANSGSCDNAKTTAALLAWIENLSYHFMVLESATHAVDLPVRLKTGVSFDASF